MKRAHIIPALIAALFAAACGSDSPTEVDTRPSVRFVNATTGTGTGGFTAAGQFAAGSALTPGSVAQTCTKVNAGITSFAFGATNAGGTAISGSPVVTSNPETLNSGGSYTVVAVGSAASPSIFVFSNTFTTELTTSQAAVRFANFLPPTGTTNFNAVFYRGAIGATTPLALNMPFGGISTYTIQPSGANTFSVLHTPGNITVIENSAATLVGGSANTMVLVPGASGTPLLLHAPRCS